MAVHRVNAWLMHPLVKPVVWCVALMPFAWLLVGALSDSLGANPAEALIRSSGDWALRGLCVALAVTPLRQLMHWNALARLRRLLGLFAFFYRLRHEAQPVLGLKQPFCRISYKADTNNFPHV